MNRIFRNLEDIRTIGDIRTNSETTGEMDVDNEHQHGEGVLTGLTSRRKFLALGGVGAAVLLGGAGAAAAVIRAGGPNPSPRSRQPVGLDPATGRNPGAVGAPPLGVRYLALAGTDGWATMPSTAFRGPAHGIADVDPYFPDPLADADRNLYVFSFRNVTGLTREQVEAQKGHTQYCAPLFYSTVGEELWVTLTNLGLVLRPDLVDGHTLHWHGFRNAIPFYDGVPESSISVPIGHDFTYVYRPEDAGTYMYHCHFEDVEHVTMGMQGIVFVKPSPSDGVGLTTGQHKAYGVADGDATGASRYHREYAILIGEVDVRAHFNDAHIQATDWTDFHADLTVLNGRAYPDTLQPNSIRTAAGDLVAQQFGGIAIDGAADLSPADDQTLGSNPLSSKVWAKVGERILIRLVNLGFQNRTFVFPGLEIDVLGRDARFVPPSAQRIATDSVQIGPGESRDIFFTAREAGTFAFYDRGAANYPGSADGSDGWVGGARSEIEVVAGPLAAQRKPNGWPGEEPWYGEIALDPNQGPSIVLADPATHTTGSGGNTRYFVTGHGVAAQGRRITDIRYAQANSAPANNSTQWRAADFVTHDAAHPDVVDYSFDQQVRRGGSARKYWFQAVDESGRYSTPVSVTV